MKRYGVLNKQAGLGMTEILVALLVLAIGVLGYAGLQLSALKKSEDANNRSEATLIAQDALERIQANDGSLATYTSATWPTSTIVPGADAPPADCVGAAKSCSGADMASWDIKQLAWSAGNQLPNGMVDIRDCNGSSMVCVIVSWGEQKPEDCLTSDGVSTAEDSNCVVMEVSR
ncbi:type IV pilus modification protein PilV [Alcanivorax hongdengensis]|nr:type IV pilus modification protein PilV [Alcanivorax hongdengensis]